MKTSTYSLEMKNDEKQTDRQTDIVTAIPEFTTFFNLQIFTTQILELK